VKKVLDFSAFLCYVVYMIKIDTTQLTEREKILLKFVIAKKK